jgi:hypothetical protein
MRGQHGQQVARMHGKNFTWFLCRRVRGALFAIKSGNFANGVAGTEEVEDHLSSIRRHVGNLDAAGQEHHQAVAGFTPPAQHVSLGVFLRMTSRYDRVERAVRQPAEKRVVSQERTNSSQYSRCHVRSPVSLGQAGY